MKKLYIELFFLAVALVASILLIEKIYASYYSPPDSVMRAFGEQKQEVTTILLGNSHVIALGEPAIFEEKSFNLAFAGISMYDISMLTKKVTGDNKGIKNVIIGLDYDILGLGGLSLLSTQLYRYTDSLESNSFGEKIKARSNYFRSGQDFKYLINRSDYSYLYTPKDSPKVKQNFVPLNFKSKNDAEACKRRAMEHGAISYKENNEEKNIEILTELIDYGKGKGLNLIFICTPKTKCYTSVYLSIPKIENAKKNLDSVFINKQCHYYDFTHEPAFNDNDFIDFDHLNASGAAKLAALLKTTQNK